MTKLFEQLQQLCELDAISGSEAQMINYVSKHYQQLGYHVEVDNMGNVVSYQHYDENKPTVGLIAHMDEIGLLVMKIDENGLLHVTNIGGIFAQTLLAKRVKVYHQDLKNYEVGTILAPPIHQMTPQQQKEVVEIDKMVIDIGLTSQKAVLEAGIKVGSMVIVDGPYQTLHDCIMSKAIDDRYGCALMTTYAMQQPQDLPFNLVYVFTAQEEVGLRGASALAYLNLDLAIILDASASSDLEDKKSGNGNLHDGVLLRFFDPGLLTPKKVLSHFQKVCQQNEIACQPFYSMGTTDAARIQLLNNGTLVIVIGVCLRNIHTCSTVASKKDIESAYQALEAFLKTLTLSQLKAFRIN